MTALSDRSVVDSPPVSKGSKDKAMPLSTMSMDLNKRDAKTKPLSSVKKARISTDYDITAAEIVKRVSILFPECNAAALVCVSCCICSLLLKSIQALICPLPWNNH